MAKHVVEVVEGWEVEVPMSALMVGDREVAPAQVRRIVYKTGDSLRFNNKKEALAFCKYHGANVRYVMK